MLWFVISLIAVAISYALLIRPYKYWSARGVKQGQPVFPLGDSWEVFLRKLSQPELVQKVYNSSPNSRYCGMYQLLEPTLVIRDPDLIKQITVKDFEHFMDHRTFTSKEADPLWNKSLFSLEKQKWREMRTILSPVFTSSKMKFLFSLMSETGEQFVEFFRKQDKSLTILEMKDVFSRFTNDVIAYSVLGVKCDSLRTRNNEFYLTGTEASDFTSFWKTAKIFGYMLMPLVYKTFKITFFSKRVQDFVRQRVKENIAVRVKEGIVRPDMMHLLLQARRNGFKKKDAEATQMSNLSKMSDEDITAQTLVFYFAGYDSVSSLMCFMSHELAVNPLIQQKLLKEVDDVLEKCNGKLTYVALTEMKYLDMVVSETLRKWPNNPLVERVCTKPYTIEPERPGEKPLHLEENSMIMLPIYALHRDPNYFPNPELFDPERFNDENKDQIKPYTYIPFGTGPRNCIGSRFALMETKVLFFYMLSHFEIVPVQKTEPLLTLRRKGFTTSAEHGFWLGLKRREK